MPRPDDPLSADLLSDFASGDDSALGHLLEREAPRIVGEMRVRLPRDVRSRLGGSDILQLTALELMRMRERFENQGVGAFRELVATLADQALSNSVRRERAQKRTTGREVAATPPRSGDSIPPAVYPVDTNTPSRTVHRKESVDRLQACLDELLEIDRTILQMIDYEELTYAQVAERLGISVSAAQKRHSRAMARLRELMSR